MDKNELIKSILNDMEYKPRKDIEYETKLAQYAITGGGYKPDDNRVYFWTHKSDTYTDFFHHAHGDFIPDDFRYQMIHEVLSNMEEYDDEYELLESLVPVYTHELMQWLSSSNSRYTYCDEYREEYGISDDKSIIDLISGGYYMELNEVYYLIVEWLKDNCEE